jgi:hypothetical protein
MNRFLGVVLVLGLLVVHPGEAAPLTLHYAATWMGLPAAEIDVQIDESMSAYRSEIDIRTIGLPRWFTRFRARGLSEGAVSGVGLAEPARYDAFYDLRSRKNKRVSLRFERKEGAVIAERGPEDGSSDSNPPLPAAQRAGVVDPLTMLNLMRAAIRTGLARSKRLTIPVYDGKRRFDVEERGLTEETWRVGEEQRRVLHLALLLHPVAGFDAHDGEGNPDATPRPLDVLFSDDDELIPLRLEVRVGYFTVVVQLAERCDGAATPCALAPR